MKPDWHAPMASERLEPTNTQLPPPPRRAPPPPHPGLERVGEIVERLANEQKPPSSESHAEKGTQVAGIRPGASERVVCDSVPVPEALDRTAESSHHDRVPSEPIHTGVTRPMLRPEEFTGPILASSRCDQEAYLDYGITRNALLKAQRLQGELATEKLRHQAVIVLIPLAFFIGVAISILVFEIFRRA